VEKRSAPKMLQKRRIKKMSDKSMQQSADRDWIASKPPEECWKGGGGGRSAVQNEI
jgi:hypothetical protein